MKKKKNKDESFEIFYEIFKKIFEKNGFLSINKKSTNFIGNEEYEEYSYGRTI